MRRPSAPGLGQPTRPDTRNTRICYKHTQSPRNTNTGADEKEAGGQYRMKMMDLNVCEYRNKWGGTQAPIEVITL